MAMAAELKQDEAFVQTTPPAVVAKKPKARIVLVGLVVVAGALGTTFYVSGLNKESTDDAQVEGRVVSVAARVQGQVAKVLVKDNQEVNAGDVLVELDRQELDARTEAARADLAAARATLTNAEAQLGLVDKNAQASLKQAQGGLAQAASSVNTTRSSIDQAEADVAGAESRMKLAQTDLDRVMKLSAGGSISQAEVDTRQSQFDQAKAAVDQGRARLASARAGVLGSSGGVALAQGRLAAAETGPQQVAAAKAAVELAAARVKQSEAALHLAELTLSYAQIRAPVKGTVSRRTVELGQMVSPDRPLLAVVPGDDVWVVANFKENQLADMHPGQPVKIAIDTYGGRRFVGHVDSIAGASGARFALLPPDNASGNFIKVVQRIPVLIRFDGADAVAFRPGMSAEVTVDTHAR